MISFQIMSKDATTCTSALAQLDELIKDKDKVVLLGERMDPLLVSCYMQLRDVLYIKLRMDNANPKEVLRLFQVRQLARSLDHLILLYRRSISVYGVCRFPRRYD